MKPDNVAWNKFVGSVVNRATAELGMKTENGVLSYCLRGMHLLGKDASVDSHKLLISQ